MNYSREADGRALALTALLCPGHPGKAAMSAGVWGDHSVPHSPLHHLSSTGRTLNACRAMLPQWELQASFSLTYLQEAPSDVPSPSLRS